MAKYKTPEQVRKELKRIGPEYLGLYDVTQNSTGTYLTREMETTIAFVPSSVGGGAGKYEVHPRVNGKNLEELFGMSDTVIGDLTLQEAVTIAEYAVAASLSPLFIQKLEEVIKEHYTKIRRSYKRTGSKTSFPIGMHRP